MVAAEARRGSALRRRAVLALAGLGVLALFALAVSLVGGFTDSGAADETHAVSTSVSNEPDHSLPIVHALRQQPSARTRTTTIVLLAAVPLVAAPTTRRSIRKGRRAFRALRLGGRPPGRAPPRLRIA